MGAVVILTMSGTPVMGPTGIRRRPALLFLQEAAFQVLYLMIGCG